MHSIDHFYRKQGDHEPYKGHRSTKRQNLNLEEMYVVGAIGASFKY